MKRLLGGLVAAIGLAVGWWFVSSYDALDRWRALNAPVERGQRRERRPPRAPEASPPSLGHVWATARRPLFYGGGLAVCGGLALLVLRVRARRRRAASIETWELVLGREDLAQPYEVAEELEGICDALRARWYERLVAGQDHLVCEIHLTLKGEVAFTFAAPRRALPTLRASLENLYPDVRLEPLGEGPSRPEWFERVARLKKRRRFIFALTTTRDYQHSFVEGLTAVLGQTEPGVSVQLVLTPAPLVLARHARRLLQRHERGVSSRGGGDPLDPGLGSVLASKDARGAVDTQDRGLFYFDLRVAGRDREAVRRIAGRFGSVRSENELVRRYMRLRSSLYSARMRAAMPNPLPSLRTGVLSSSEVATLWHLPRTRLKHAPIRRSSVRRAAASTATCRDPQLQLMRDEAGPVGLWPADRKFGLALLGGQGGGKSSVMARVGLADALDPGKAIVAIDPKEDLARLLLGLMPEWRTVHYLDLGAPECGLNPLTVPGSPASVASLFVQSLIEANPPGAIQAASDTFLRNAVAAVAAVEGPRATLHHLYQMFSTRSAYRDRVIAELKQRKELAFLCRYWGDEFPDLVGEKRFAAQRLDPPKNKLSRLITGIDVALHHPYQLDVSGIIERGEVLIVNGAKGQAGEDNTRLMGQLVLQLVHRALQRQQRLAPGDRRRVSLLVDEAHNFLTPTIATLLAEGRSAGLEATFAWQYTAQIADERVRSGVKSLLQSISLFRMREMEDARSMAGLAMEVYSDRIDTQEDAQERLRFSVEDVLRLPQHHAINLWVANGSPSAGHVGQTLPMEELADAELNARRESHLARQRERGGYPLRFLPDPLKDLLSEEGRDPDADADYEPEVAVPPPAPDDDDDGDVGEAVA